MLVNMSGGKKVENIINEIVEPVLLWTNPNPRNTFSPQTINVNGAEYSSYLIEVRFSDSDGNTGVSLIPIGGKGACITPNSNFVAPYASRAVLSTNANSIQFGAGMAYSTDNTKGIPTRVWGVKYTV